MDRRLPLRERVHPVVRWLSCVYLVPRREWLKRRLDRTVFERIRDLDLVVPRGVFNPVLFRTGRYFAEFIADSARCDPALFPAAVDSRALDCTTGSGAQALMLARRGFLVTAVDLNPDAVRAARTNAILNGLEDRVHVVEGDLFGPVDGSRFDLVVCAPPLFRGDPSTGFDQSWRSPDFLERFAEGLSSVLAPKGSALALFTTDGDQDGFLGALERHDFDVTVESRKHFGNEVISIYGIRTRR